MGSSHSSLAVQQHEAPGERLPRRPDLWNDPVTGEPTPHRAALGWFHDHADLSDDEAAVELSNLFQFFGPRNAYKNALQFVRNRRRLINSYHRMQEAKAQNGRDNYTNVLFALRSVGEAKVEHLVVAGTGREGGPVPLSTATKRRHLQRARKAGLVTVSHDGIWRQRV